LTEEFFADEVSTLDEVAAAEWGFLTIGQVRRHIEAGVITLNGACVGRSARVSPGDLIAMERDEEGEGEIAPVASALTVIYDDAALIAVDKPAGVPVVPERGSSEWRFMGMLLYHAEKCPSCAGVRFRVVHRLDRDTSGVVVLAKTVEAGRALGELFAGRQVRKRYLAIVRGTGADDGGTIDAPIGPSGRRGALMAVGQSGKASVTEWRVVERFRGLTLVEVFPHTGRTHQIRVHMAYAGMPLAVDEMYGGGRALLLSQLKRGYKHRGEERPLIDRLTLHCAGLEFAHPVGGQILTLAAELPEDFSNATKALRKWAPV
jgi:23S rRNA pseudouridine1911/1915/1917 synthase